MGDEICRSVDKRELVDYIVAHPNINYIATVVSPYAFIGARAVLHYIKELYGLDYLNGIMVATPWGIDKWAITKELPMSEKYHEFYNPLWMKMKQTTKNRIKDLCKAIWNAKKKKTARQRKMSQEV